MQWKNVGFRIGSISFVGALLIGLSVCAADGGTASAAEPSGVHVETVWQAGDATVTGLIAPGTQLRVHAVLNPACKVGHFTRSTCLPQSLLGWETITEDGIFSPAPAPAAPYGVCQGDTTLVVNGHMHTISGQLFACFTE